MPHRRTIKKGSFGGHFDELVGHFPEHQQPAATTKDKGKRSAELQEKIDIHALLFERAWSEAHE